MRIIFLTLLVGFTSFTTFVSGAARGDELPKVKETLKLEMLIEHSTPEFIFYCRATNISEKLFMTYEPFRMRNVFGVKYLDVDHKIEREVYPCVSVGPPLPGDEHLVAPTVKIAPETTHQWKVGLNDISRMLGRGDLLGHIVAIRWNLDGYNTQAVQFFIPDANGRVAPPVVDAKANMASANLAVLCGTQEATLVCYLANSTKQAVNVPKPMTSRSIIAIKATSINYTHSCPIET
jgi:hypothetical protein